MVQLLVNTPPSEEQLQRDPFFPLPKQNKVQVKKLDREQSLQIRRQTTCAPKYDDCSVLSCYICLFGASIHTLSTAAYCLHIYLSINVGHHCIIPLGNQKSSKHTASIFWRSV